MKQLRLLAALAVVMLASSCVQAATDAIDPVGTWGREATGEPNLVLGADGTVIGSDGCNRLLGSYTTADGGVEFTPFAGTRMFCEGVDTWLSGAASARLSQNALEILDQNGNALGTLNRTG